MGNEVSLVSGQAADVRFALMILNLFIDVVGRFPRSPIQEILFSEQMNHLVLGALVSSPNASQRISFLRMVSSMLNSGISFETDSINSLRKGMKTLYTNEKRNV